MELKHAENGKFLKLPTPSKDELGQLYLRDNLTPSKIGELKHVSSNTVRRWLHEYNIPAKRPYLSYVKPELSNVESAYLAGYLDGDGTICAGLTKSDRSKMGYGAHPEVSLMTCKEAFAKELRKMIGGKLQTFLYRDSREKKQGFKIAFCNQRSALAFLEQIQPFLILKRQQAKLMVAFLRQRIKAREGGNSVPISTECWEFIYEIRRLNHGTKGSNRKIKP